MFLTKARTLDPFIFCNRTSAECIERVNETYHSDRIALAALRNISATEVSGMLLLWWLVGAFPVKVTLVRHIKKDGCRVG